ncbi:MAG: DUF1189 family protein [Acholeplasmataceae bacterium]|nr:DUF1189 family protein [Acholeplasmataceae bacterium]
MFLVRIFRDSFIFNRVLKLRYEAFWKLGIYFIIISLISLFSFNFTNLRTGGWKLGFVENILLLEKNYDKQLPSSITIRKLSGVNSTDGDQLLFYENNEGKIIRFWFVTNESEDFVNTDIDLNAEQLIFTNKKTYYVKGDGKGLMIGSYQNFPEEISFETINTLPDNERRVQLTILAETIEKSFGRQNAFFTIVTFSSVQLALYVVLVLLLALVLQLFRFVYVDYMSYIDGVKIVISTMTIPSVISFIIGFFTHALTPVIVQLGLGIILMLIMIKYGKKEFSA